MSNNKSYTIAYDGIVYPVCQRCGKGTSFYPKEYPDNSPGCECCNPIITKIAWKKHNEHLKELEEVKP